MSNEVKERLLLPRSRQESAAQAAARLLDEQPNCFAPTPEELSVLASYWVRDAIRVEYFVFWGQCYGGCEIREMNFDWKRVSEIAAVLGVEATRTVVEDAYQEAAQDYDRNDWIVFRYGTHEEKNAYQEMGGQCLEEFDAGVADRLASQVMERAFCEVPEKLQMSILKTELKRYSTKLHGLKSGPRNIIELFDIDFPSEVKLLVLSIGVEDPQPNPRWNTFFKTLTLEQGKAILAALDEIARKGEDALKELVAEPTYFVNTLGLKCLTVEGDERVRFSILPFKTATLANSFVVILPVVHYLNADPVTGRYEKNADGSGPPVEWEIRYLGLSSANVNEIADLVDQDQTPFDMDFLISSDGLYRASKKARWKLNPELAAEVEKAAIEASNVFEAKLFEKPGVTIFDDFRGVDPQHSKTKPSASVLSD